MELHTPAPDSLHTDNMFSSFLHDTIEKNLLIEITSKIRWDLENIEMRLRAAV